MPGKSSIISSII